VVLILQVERGTSCFQLKPSMEAFPLDDQIYFIRE
jgi:hypothetical protein